jgi:hypothetical protein
LISTKNQFEFNTDRLATLVDWVKVRKSTNSGSNKVTDSLDEVMTVSRQNCSAPPLCHFF